MSVTIRESGARAQAAVALESDLCPFVPVSPAALKGRGELRDKPPLTGSRETTLTHPLQASPRPPPEEPAHPPEEPGTVERGTFGNPEPFSQWNVLARRASA